MIALKRVACFLAMGVVALFQWGCQSSADQELRTWMSEERKRAVPKVTPISEPKRYVPMNYTQSEATDPFGFERLTQALRREAGDANVTSRNLLTPELERRKEPLESYPLDALTMVGSLSRSGQPMALVRVENLLYQIRLGNYLGQNYGRVTKITENQIVLREIVQDAAGEWIERAATLELQESTK